MGQSHKLKVEMLEKIIVVLVIVAAVFFAKFPTLYNALHTPAGYWFPKQTSWFDAWDTNVQVSYIRYGQRRGLLLENTYTTIPHAPVFIYQFYTGLGVINRLLRLDPFVLFHLSSIVTSVFLLLISYFVVRVFIKDRFLRISTFFVIALGAGFGWFPSVGHSADTQVAGFTMINAFERGHDALSTLLLLSCLTLYFLFISKGKKRYLFGALLSSFASITIHPPLVALYASIGGFESFVQFISKKRFIAFIFPIMNIVFFGIYYFFMLAKLVNNPGFSGVVGQQLFSLDSFSIAAGFGVISIFITWMSVFSKYSLEEVEYLKLFFFIQLFLAFSPFGFHLYFVKGLHVWGVILAFFGIEELITRRNIQKAVIIIVLCLSFITRFYIFNRILNPNKNNSFFFLTSVEGDALNFFSAVAPDSGVLSLYRMGNYIPAFSDARVYYGHRFQTPNSTEALQAAQLFYTSTDQDDQREFLKSNHIQYVYYGLEEIQLRSDTRLATANPFPYFSSVYTNGPIIVYKVAD